MTKAYGPAADLFAFLTQQVSARAPRAPVRMMTNAHLVAAVQYLSPKTADVYPERVAV